MELRKGLAYTQKATSSIIWKMKKTKEKKVTSGVPQGKVYGPIFFFSQCT